MIEFEQVKKHYKDYQALKGITLDVYRGDIYRRNENFPLVLNKLYQMNLDEEYKLVAVFKPPMYDLPNNAYL
ncbi:hypothetical protein [Xenorhabdus entomophaga]|uniref:hypothetical protein n=1 Tax=Xenorhabdus entomophaga TaxID=3136257 RepID=UPI0030F4A9E4